LDQSAATNAYWESRKNLVYYQVARILTEKLGAGCKSMIDVGSSGCPYLDWFQFIPDRTSLDLLKPYRAEGIVSIKADFLSWEPQRRYDLVTCMQVLEHVPDAAGFARKLLSIGDVVIVSVPYKWPAGECKHHVHDPVDEEKMQKWFGRAPNFSYVCREVDEPIMRLIQVYEPRVRAWRGTNERGLLLSPVKRGHVADKDNRSDLRRAWDQLARLLR
jgi:hypothetical protein